jgi:cardiolipin synthase
MTWLIAVLLFFLFQAATVLVLEHRRPANAVAWLFILFLFPLVGFVLYYFLAHEYRRRRKARKREGDGRSGRRRNAWMGRIRLLDRPELLPSPEFAKQDRLFRLLARVEDAPITGRNRTSVLTNAQATYEQMLAAIRAARRHIHFSSYIIRDDATGRLFRDLLAEKAREGVQVRLLYDGIGSHKLKKSFFRPLEASGASYACFFPLRPSFFKKRMNYRNHRKILVADGRKGFIGGINIGDEYLGKDRRLGFWRDTHLLVEGDAVYELQEVFLRDWELATGERPDDPSFFPAHDCPGSEAVQIVSGGPNRREDAIHETLYALFSAARERIWITTPYFIPTGSLAMALRTASLSGADVRLLIPLVPDTYLVYYASLSYLEDLMRAGVRVWQYEKGFVHAKVVLIDRLLASVGTANMDLRSFFSNFEMNAHLFDPGAIARLEEDFLRDLGDSRELTLDAYQSRTKAQRLKETVARMLSPLL